MQQVKQINELIDLAASIAGSDYKLAKMIGVSRMTLSDWRHGRRTATPEDQVLIADIAGLDTQATLARAIVEKHEGTAKGERLMKVLGKGLLLTGAAIATAGAKAVPIGLTAGSAYLIRCIERLSLELFFEYRSEPF